MISELRWALLILGALFIVALIFWERRRPRQASGGLERMPVRDAIAEPAPRLVREPPLTLPEVRVREPVGAAELPVVETFEDPPLPVLESAQRPPPALEEQALTEDDDTVDDLPTLVLGAEDAAEESFEPAPREEPILEEVLPQLPAGAPLVVDWPAVHERRILALRLVAPQRERFPGRSLRQALAAEGFLLGQFAIFHKPDDERRAVLSAASLTRPGTFDMDTMDSQHYGGLSLFAVLPGPKPARQAFDELVFAARNLNERLQGVLQDEQGTPLTPARIEQLREQFRAGAVS
ncbi:MAG TPA: cell division protein ZipA C-terminal FtsZ-binding domain-containing protein [Steroidobacteraceae bacterium]|nr:cell division protein ZipA C-terminal FtsZ-binding domain-containing protein [Steroidobacteraceae bacterium]